MSATPKLAMTTYLTEAEKNAMLRRLDDPMACGSEFNAQAAQAFRALLAELAEARRLLGDAGAMLLDSNNYANPASAQPFYSKTLRNVRAFLAREGEKR